MATETVPAENRRAQLEQALLRYIAANPVPTPDRASEEIEAELAANELAIEEATLLIARLTQAVSPLRVALDKSRRLEATARAREDRLAQAEAADLEAQELDRHAGEAAAALTRLEAEAEAVRGRLDALRVRVGELQARAKQGLALAEERTAAADDEGALAARSDALDAQREAAAIADQELAVSRTLVTAEAAVAAQAAAVDALEEQAATSRVRARDHRWAAAGGTYGLQHAIERNPFLLLLDPDRAVAAMLKEAGRD